MARQMCADAKRVTVWKWVSRFSSVLAFCSSIRSGAVAHRYHSGFGEGQQRRRST
jgi:hypothetical protein